MIEMVERPENPVGALESSLTEEAGYGDDSTAKPIARKKKNTRKRRHGESIESIKLLQNLSSQYYLNTEFHDLGVCARTRAYTAQINGRPLTWVWAQV